MNATLPWQVDEWELGSDLAKIEQQWPSLRTILEDRYSFDCSEPGVSGWSCGQHVGHAVLVARTIADRVQGNLANPDRHRDQSAPELALRVLKAGRIPRGSAVSPREVDPVLRDRQEMLSLLAPTIAAWAQIGARAEELPDCAARFPHFRLGPLDSVEWVRLCALHTAHHLDIVRDITGASASDTPSAEATS